MAGERIIDAAMEDLRPQPPPLPPSALTPRTAAAKARGREIGAAIKRNIELVLALLGAAGITLAQVADGIAAMLAWGRKAGLWAPLALIGLGVAASGIRQLLGVIQGLSQQLNALTSQWQRQHGELRGEVGELRGEVAALRKEILLPSSTMGQA